ncbi:uncharacterized protein [Haliotis asinina]|uniref:uncharacterized protein n=1 Tax=Haliotis asinina TaxID=109174 RepID=UPI003531F1B1
MSGHTKYSILRLLLLLFNGAIVCGAVGKTCSSVNQLPVVERSRLRGAIFDTFFCSGLVICAKECLSRHACRSHNFNLDDGTCELCKEAGPGANGSAFMTRDDTFAFSESHNWPQHILSVCRGHNCPNNTRCVETSDNSRECVIAYCTAPPTVENSIASSPIGYFTPVNQSLPLKCIVGYVACGNVTCNPDGSWTKMTCMPVSNCPEVRKLSSTYTDGEYWLYPRLLNGSRVKVYCHAMNSTPSEYISLSTPYFIVATQVNNCSWWHSRFYLGYYVLTKIGLDIENLTINKLDRTFVNKTNRSRAVDVGTVVGCSPLENSTCGAAGQAVLDLRGTGLRLKENELDLRGVGIAFNHTANRSFYSSRNMFTAALSSYNQLVVFRCALHCGICFVASPMYISVAESDGFNGSTWSLTTHANKGSLRKSNSEWTVSTRRQCNNPDLRLNLEAGSTFRLFEPLTLVVPAL